MNLARCIKLWLLVVAIPVWAETPISVHSLEVFARNIFEHYRAGDFKSFHQSTVFALSDDYFKQFILKVRNDKIRNALTKGEWAKWQQAAEEEDPEAEKKLEHTWKVACLEQWRKTHRRLKDVGLKSIRYEAFDSILLGAEKEGIQWKTAHLNKVEVVHEVSLGQKHFKIDGVDSPVLYWEPGLSYRLRFDNATHGHPFRLATLPEGPIVDERGVATDRSGNRDVMVHFNQAPKSLYYFCPDKPGMGNRINFSSGKKHPMRNVLLTFSYGNPQRSYRILLRDCLPIPPPPALGEISVWNRWLLFERPVWLGPVNRTPSIE